ncbi:FAD-binding and (Fe-S)-binding domain-containing protein [soil metagenome]
MIHSDLEIKQKSVTGKPSVDESALEKALRERMEGEVLFDAGSKALYSRDGSNYRQVPIGVVRPKSAEDVARVLEVCRQFKAPVLSRGGGTSLAGQCCNWAVVMDMSRHYKNVLNVDAQNRTITVQPGIVLDVVREKAKEQGLIFGPDPATHTHNTIGGMLGNNSCGIHSVMASKDGPGARTSDNLESLEIITYDGTRMSVGPTSEEDLTAIIEAGGRKGEIYQQLRNLRDKYADLIRERFPKIPRRVSGYNLDDLLPENGFNVARALVGSEGTCVTILEATLTLVPNPKERVVMVVGFENVCKVGEYATKVLAYDPIGLEGTDDKLISYMKNSHLREDELEMLPEGFSCMITEWAGDTIEEARGKAEKALKYLQSEDVVTAYRIYEDDEDQEKVWAVRESGLGATAFVPGLEDSWPGWEDSAVPPEKIGDYLDDLQQLFKKYDYKASLYGHFGQGCVHCRIPFDLVTQEGLENYRKFVEEAADLVLSYGGSLSGEHGDGQARGELLEKMYGPELMEAFREFKRIWDPEGRMNPGKVIDADPILANLRLGTDYSPKKVKTHFQFPDDKYTFDRSALRCVGIGECRRLEGGVMCPSYMVTHEEKHSTRGRATLLFEMLQGEVIQDGWQSEEVKEALDLCLACKGCKGDCPVNVDMATYKAEFLSHYYEKHLRPRHAYAFGLITIWSRLAALIPGLTNFVMQAPLLGSLVKKTAGMAPQRKFPRYASQTFREWFQRREPKNRQGRKIILWPDTFNNYFHPQTAKAAVEVLEHFGFRVTIPTVRLCCGRPLYDYGMLDMAKKWLKEILAALEEDIRDGTPVVGLEPSCTATFRDELINFFPNEEDAQRLSKQTYMLSEFLMKYVEEDQLPKLKAEALIHNHCHHESVMRTSDEKKVLQRLGLDFTILDSGCCGMAGSFGFEEEHYDLSMKVGERVLLPKIREAKEDTLLIANGFSCREQIMQGSNREALHLAEVLHLAIHQGLNGKTGQTPEAYYKQKFLQEDSAPVASTTVLAAAGAVFAVSAFLLWRQLNR